MSGGYKAFISSDGMEILAGNKDRDNDYLTLKVASAQDFWLHVADNSGAHVIVRNENKVKRLPKNTSPSELTSHLSQKKRAWANIFDFFLFGGLHYHPGQHYLLRRSSICTTNVFLLKRKAKVGVSSKGNHVGS